MINIGDLILPIDINTIIDKINAEGVRRDVTTPVFDHRLQDHEIDKDTIYKMAQRNELINNNHCYCESDPTMSIHHGGDVLPLNINSSNIDGEIEESDINGLLTDINAMSAQTNCSIHENHFTTYYCDYNGCHDGCWSVCGVHTYGLNCATDCHCQNYCSYVGDGSCYCHNVCPCQNVCSCDAVCNCEFVT